MIFLETLPVKMVLDAWNTQLARTGKLFESLSDEQLGRPCAPGRNTGVYLLGHLVAIHDGLRPLLGIGERLYPAYEAIFVGKPDGAVTDRPPVAELRKAWTKVHAQLAEDFSKLGVADWFGRHTAVSPEDFAREPHRNRLNVLLTRTTHLASHYGQLLYARP